MPYATGANATIYYETMGDSSHPTLILMEGFTKQLLGWKPEFCRRIVDAGIHLVLFDNRDAGLTQKFGGRTDFDGGYSAHDMADDVFTVLDDLGIEAAHVGGQSMGGVLAQLAAVHRPERVLSLTLFYTTSALEYVFPTSQRPDLGQVQPDRTREEYVRYYLENEILCGSEIYPFDEAWHRDLAGRSYDRSYTPDGPTRQAAAFLRIRPDWLKGVAGSDVPAIIAHGRADRLIDYRASIALAEALPGAELHIYPGLGHEIPKELIGEFAAHAIRTVARGEARKRAR
jgi:pimeloyl-ACP methyl ester carboxylesterase